MPGEITRLLYEAAGADGDAQRDALDRLFPLIYDELRRVAHRQLRRERAGHTLRTTALVHEAYVKLAERPLNVDWAGRQHFYGIAARAMRQILVNWARDRGAQKRGGGVRPATLEEHLTPGAFATDRPPAALLDLDRALDRLEAMGPRQARVVELRYFAGLSVEETADTLGVSNATVKRDWAAAKAWLYAELQG